MRRLILLSIAMFAAFGLSGCSYNELTAKQQNVRGKWSNVESSLQRRADLIPNLVEAAKMAGVQEQEVFGQIADARSRLLNATSQPAAGEGGDRTPEQREQIITAANSFGGTIGCELDKPPSTGKAWPFTYEASSEARNKAICAISTGAPARRSGFS